MDVPIELIVAAFDEPGKADEVLKDLKNLEKDDLINLVNAAVIVKDANGKGHFDRGKDGLRLPGIGIFQLIAFLVQSLPEISVSIGKRNGNHREFQIGCRTKHIAGENAQSSTIGRDCRIQSNLHAEVGDFWRAFLRHHSRIIALGPPSRRQAISAYVSYFALIPTRRLRD